MLQRDRDYANKELFGLLSLVRSSTETSPNRRATGCGARCARERAQTHFGSDGD